MSSVVEWILMSHSMMNMYDSRRRREEKSRVEESQGAMQYEYT
jgi:hypothetical protein